MEIEDLKQKSASIRQSWPAGRSRHWPQDFRRDVVNYCKTGSVVSASKAIGITSQAIRLWIAKSSSHSDQNLFREVSVTSLNSDHRGIVLQWPGMLQVEGLTFSQLQELLREGLL